jgi:hypothetical protein
MWLHFCSILTSIIIQGLAGKVQASTGGTSASNGTWKFWLVWTVVGCRWVSRAGHWFKLFIMGGVSYLNQDTTLQGRQDVEYDSVYGDWTPLFCPGTENYVPTLTATYPWCQGVSDLSDLSHLSWDLEELCHLGFEKDNYEVHDIFEERVRHLLESQQESSVKQAGEFLYCLGAYLYCKVFSQQLSLLKYGSAICVDIILIIICISCTTSGEVHQFCCVISL